MYVCKSIGMYVFPPQDVKDKSADASISVYETAWGIKGSGKDPASTKSTELRIVEYSAKGDLADPRDVLRGHGHDLGTFAAEKSDVDQRVFEISALDAKGGGEAKAVLKSCDGSSTKSVPLSEFVSLWSAVDPAKALTKASAWPSEAPEVSEDEEKSWLQHSVATALYAVCRDVRQRCPPGEAVDLFTKPVRKVVAKKAFVSRMLVLVPFTKAIKVITKAERQANHVQVTMTGRNPLIRSHDVILLPFVQVKAPVPAWWVTNVRNAEEANMAWTVITNQSLDTVDICPTKVLAKGLGKKKRYFQHRAKGGYSRAREHQGHCRGG